MDVFKTLLTDAVLAGEVKITTDDGLAGTRNKAFSNLYQKAKCRVFIIGMGNLKLDYEINNAFVEQFSKVKDGKTNVNGTYICAPGPPEAPLMKQ